MISTLLVTLWLTLSFCPQTTQSCNGDCQEGYRSVCVQRGSNCRCSCIKDVAAGTQALRDLLSAYNVSEATINEAQERYKETARSTSGEFSFTVYDSGTGELTIRGQGLAGVSTIVEVSNAAKFSSLNGMVNKNQSQGEKTKVFRKKPRTRKRPRNQSP